MAAKDIGYQLAPPHIHRAKLAETAIKTFKSHFEAGLASLDSDFPLTEYNRLILQAVLTLNLLRSGRFNPTYQYILIFLAYLIIMQRY